MQESNTNKNLTPEEENNDIIKKVQLHLNRHLPFRSISASFWTYFVVFFGIYFVFTIFFNNVFLTATPVQGASMYPTINKQYTLSQNQNDMDVAYIFNTKNVDRGDIVTFTANNYTGQDKIYIKRIIAKEGDTIQFVKKSEAFNTSIESFVKCDVFLNGQKLNENYILEDTLIQLSGYDYSNNEFYRNLANGITTTVPKDHYFVMGDNRNNSTDSRYFGFVNKNDICGKMVILVESGHTIFYGIYHSIKKDYLF